MRHRIEIKFDQVLMCKAVQYWIESNMSSYRKSIEVSKVAHNTLDTGSFDVTLLYSEEEKDDS